MFLWNNGWLSPEYTVLYPWGQSSSIIFSDVTFREYYLAKTCIFKTCLGKLFQLHPQYASQILYHKRFIVLYVTKIFFELQLLVPSFGLWKHFFVFSNSTAQLNFLILTATKSKLVKKHVLKYSDTEDWKPWIQRLSLQIRYTVTNLTSVKKYCSSHSILNILHSVSFCCFLELVTQITVHTY